MIGTDGSTVPTRRSEVLGTVAEIPTRRQAEQLLADRVRHVNSGNYRPQSACAFRSFVQDQWERDAPATITWDTDCSGTPCDPVGAGLIQANLALIATP